MNRLIIVIGGISLVLAVYLNLSRPICAYIKNIDLGTHDFGSKVPFRLKIVNEGWGLLKIAKVRTSCSCVLTSAGELTLAANEFSFIEGTVRLPADEENWSETIVFQTNDKANPVGQVLLKAKVEKLFNFSPESLIFSSTDRAKTVELAFGPSYGDVHFEKLTTSTKNLSCAIISTNARQIVCQVTLVDNAPQGEFDEEIIFDLATTAGKVKKNLRVGGVIGNQFQVSPSFAMLKKTKAAEIQFKWTGGSPPKWVTAKFSAQGYDSDLGSFQLSDDSFSISVNELSREIKSPARITLETDRSQLVNIPVYFVK